VRNRGRASRNLRTETNTPTVPRLNSSTMTRGSMAYNGKPWKRSTDRLIAINHLARVRSVQLAPVSAVASNPGHISLTNWPINSLYPTIVAHTNHRCRCLTHVSRLAYGGLSSNFSSPSHVWAILVSLYAICAGTAVAVLLSIHKATPSIAFGHALSVRIALIGLTLSTT
jgi:hypothetical protein